MGILGQVYAYFFPSDEVKKEKSDNIRKEYKSWKLTATQNNPGLSSSADTLLADLDETLGDNKSNTTLNRAR